MGGATEPELQRIVIEFRDKSRAPVRTEYWPPEEASRAFRALANALEAAGPEGEGWIRAGETVVVRASEVHNITLEEHVSVSFFFGSDDEGYMDRQF